MLLNPTDRYLERKGKREGKLDLAKKLIEDGHSIDYVVKLSGLTKEDILKSK